MWSTFVQQAVRPGDSAAACADRTATQVAVSPETQVLYYYVFATYGMDRECVCVCPVGFRFLIPNAVLLEVKLLVIF